MRSVRTIQALYNFLEASLKWHALFDDTVVEREGLKLTLKSLSVKRWSCRWEAVKVVKAAYGQVERIEKAMLTLSSSKDPKTCSDSRDSSTAILCFYLHVFKIILSNTNSLCRYLQGKTVDIVSTRRNDNMTIQTLRQCRSEGSFSSAGRMADSISNKWV